MIDVAILAGGLGTRLAPITQSLPKALIEINGEPFVAHQLRLLRSRGITRVVLCLGYRGEMIRDLVADGARFGLDVSYSFDGSSLLGTAGAIRQALSFLGEDFFVLYGDSYLNCDFAAVESAFRQSGKLGLMTVYRNKGKFDLSNVEMAGGSIVKYDKRNRTPSMQQIDYGLGAFRREAFADLAAGAVYDLAQLYRELLADGELAAFEVNDRFYEIGSCQGIRELSEMLALGERKTE